MGRFCFQIHHLVYWLLHHNLSLKSHWQSAPKRDTVIPWWVASFFSNFHYPVFTYSPFFLQRHLSKACYLSPCFILLILDFSFFPSLMSSSHPRSLISLLLLLPRLYLLPPSISSLFSSYFAWCHRSSFSPSPSFPSFKSLHLGLSRSFFLLLLFLLSLLSFSYSPCLSRTQQGRGTLPSRDQDGGAWLEQLGHVVHCQRQSDREDVYLWWFVYLFV